MKASVWNILSVAFLIGTVFLVVIFGIIFLMPNQVLPASLRPVQVPDKLLLPTPTETAFQFPATWTKSPPPVTPSDTPVPTETPLPTETPETIVPTNTIDPNATLDPSGTAAAQTATGLILASQSSTGTVTHTLTPTRTNTLKIVVIGVRTNTPSKTKKVTKTPTPLPTSTPGGPSAFLANDDYLEVGPYPAMGEINVLENDNNWTFTPIRIVKIYKGPSHGRIEVLRDNATVQYWADEGYMGPDKFQYKMTNTGGLTSYAWCYISVSDGSLHSPDSISIDNNEILENQAAGTFIGQLSSTDPDPGDTFTYKLVSGSGDSGNTSFLLSAGGALTSKTVFNREDQAVYKIRVRTTDQTGLFYEQNLNIYILDVNEPPIIISSDKCTVYVGYIFICTVRAIDNDPGDYVTFSLTPSNPATWPPFVGALAVDGNSASIAGIPSLGDVGTYTFALTATDALGGLTDTQTIKLIVELE